MAQGRILWWGRGGAPTGPSGSNLVLISTSGHHTIHSGAIRPDYYSFVYATLKAAEPGGGPAVRTALSSLNVGLQILFPCPTTIGILGAIGLAIAIGFLLAAAPEAAPALLAA